MPCEPSPGTSQIFEITYMDETILKTTRVAAFSELVFS